MAEKPSDAQAPDSVPFVNPYGWLDSVSDEELEANAIRIANEERKKMGLPPWEETPAGKASIARKNQKKE